jgi:tRNA A37 threonylcarbamoyladenosine synthetase subunit TsaC/SUA5/YrdC
MSFAKKDRSLQSDSGKTFPELTPSKLSAALAKALKQEFGALASSVKTVAKLTNSNERAVRKWFDGKNSPSADNLIVLMRHSDQILRTVLELADRRDLVLAVGLSGLRAQLVDVLSAIDEIKG